MMAAGHYKASADAFSNALQNIKPWVDSQDETLESSIKSWRLATTRAYIRESPADLFSIFNHCFVVLPNETVDTAVSRVPPATKDTLVIPMVYNFALASHLAGLQDTTTQKYHFQRADRLYRFALGITQNLDCTDESVKVIFAIANNLAALALELCDHDTFEMCRRWVGRISTEMDGLYSDFFVDNFTSMIAVSEWPAPAA